MNVVHFLRRVSSKRTSLEQKSGCTCVNIQRLYVHFSFHFNSPFNNFYICCSESNQAEDLLQAMRHFSDAVVDGCVYSLYDCAYVKVSLVYVSVWLMRTAREMKRGSTDKVKENNIKNIIMSTLESARYYQDLLGMGGENE